MIQVLYFTSIKWDLKPSRIFMSLGADMPSAARFGILIGIDGRDSFSLRQLAMAAARAVGACDRYPGRLGYFLKDKSKFRPS